MAPRVHFLWTANNFDTIPAPLPERVERGGRRARGEAMDSGESAVINLTKHTEKVRFFRLCQDDIWRSCGGPDTVEK